MIEIEEAIRLITSEIEPKTDVICIEIDEAVGKVLAEDIYAPCAVPHFPKSAMDGYAVNHKDIESATMNTPVKLKVIGHIYAGDMSHVTYQENTAVNVMTGGYIPQGYDAVVKQEDTDYGEDEVVIYSSVSAYQNYCKVGEDIEQGERVLSKGTYLEPIHIGLLASLGICKVNVIAPLKVAILCTGSEILELNEELVTGKIYGSISYMLGAFIRKAGFQIVLSKICKDDKEEIQKDILNAVQISDIVITTGGVSVGKKDFIPDVLESMGAIISFKHVNIQPGTPTMGSVFKGTPILSLSGNPYAAFANFQIYFWNIASTLMECKKYVPKQQKAVLRTEYNKKNKLRRLVRGYVEDGEVYIPTEVHASSVLSNLSICNCLIDIEAGAKLQEGDTVRVQTFDYWI